MRTQHDLIVKKLKEYTQALALPHGRKVGGTGHDVARDYLLNQMELIQLVPFIGDCFEINYELPHPNTKVLQKFTNIVGVIPGKDRSLPPILLGAHYDSVIDAPCVDDNATSVAMNLVIAHEYVLQPMDRDLIIAFFDAEEPPFFCGETMGSRRFCEDYCKDIEFAAVIVSDLIGHDASATDLALPAHVNELIPDLHKLLAVSGAESDASFPDIIERAVSRSRGLRIFPLLDRYIANVSDHGSFVDAGHPFLFFSCGQGKHYHTPQDTMDWINFEKLARITSLVKDVIDQINTMPQHRTGYGHDTFEFEMRMIRKLLGLALPAVLKFLKISIPKNREELESIVIQGITSKLR